MRILVYCDDPCYGGTAVNANLLAPGFADHGWSVGLASSLEVTGIRNDILFVPLDYNTQLLRHKNLASRNESESAFLAFRPDLVFFCDSGPEANLAAKAVCLDWGVPYVVMVNYVATGQAENMEPWLRREVTRTLGAALFVVAVSSENLLLLHRDYGILSHRSCVIYNGRPPEWFASPAPGRREALRRTLGLGPHDILFLTVARYEPRKGYRYLLEAARAVRNAPLSQRPLFAWIGQSLADGEEQLRLAVELAELEATVTVLGERSDIRDWMAAADVFVLPSEAEGMPLCLIEAMGQALPVVASGISGVPELVGEAGILLPDPRPAPRAMVTALAHSLVALAADPALRRDLGRAGQERVRLHFTAETMLASYTALLKNLEQAISAARPDWSRLAERPLSHTVSPGRTIAWGRDESCVEYLKEGWGHGENTGRWTIGDRARLVLALPPELQAGFVLSFEAGAFLGADDAAPLTTSITVNGQLTGYLNWSGSAAPRWVELAVMPVGATWPRVEVVLHIHGASSPASHGLSGDMRLLGLWLTQVRLDPFPRTEGAS